MSNTQLLSILVNKLGLLLNSIKLMKLPGMVKPSSKMEETVVLHQPINTAHQFMVEMEKLPTLFQTKVCQDMLELSFKRTLKPKRNMIITGNKCPPFLHITKWTTPGTMSNSIRKMRLPGIRKPSSKMVVSAELNQPMETAIQFMVEMELQPTLSPTKECPVMLEDDQCNYLFI